MPHDSLENRWAEIKKSRKVTVADLAKALKHRFGIERGCSEQNLGELIKDTEGKSPERKKQIRAIFEEWERAPVSVFQGPAKTVEPPIAFQEEAHEYLTVAECKQRIKQLEMEVARLRAAIHTITAPLNSEPPLTEAQKIAKQAGDAHDDHPPK